MNIDEIHSRLLDIMVEVDAFCRREGIRYSLAFGTFLGAVRHGGFIPWDDDADIIMPRPDFERFISGFNGRSGSRFRCLYNSRKPDEYFVLGFAKVHDPSTLKEFDPRKTDFHYGVSLDIFPLDAVPEEPDARHEFMHRVISLGRRLYYRTRKIPFGSPILLAQTHIHSLDWWWKRVRAVSEENDYDGSPLIAHMLGSRTYESVHRKELFDDLSDIQFEERQFLAFRDADAYLTQVFGPDYMTPPPENERFGHGARIFKL